MKLQLYVLREISINFIMTALSLGFVVFLSAAVLASYKIPGAPPALVLGYVPLIIMYIFPYLLPISLLVGVVLTCGRLSAENEITAMRAGGIHLWTVLGPCLVVGIILALVNLPLVEDIIPRFHYKKRTYLKEIATQLLANLPPNQREISFDTFYLEWENRRDEYFYDIYLKYKSGEDKEYRVMAEMASIKPLADDYLQIKLVNAQNLDDLESGTIRDSSVQLIVYNIQLDELRGSERFATTKISEEATTELAVQLQRNLAENPRRATYEIQKRVATVFSGFLFALIGVPIGIFMRKGNRLSAFGVAFLTVMGGYYPIVYLMEMLGREAKINPWVGAWGPNVLLFFVAMILVQRLFRI